MRFSQFFEHGYSQKNREDAWLNEKVFWIVTRKGAIEGSLYIATLAMIGLMIAALIY